MTNGQKSSDLLNRKLKDHIIKQLLEMHDVRVIYDFDRTHENLPDACWAGFKQAGFQLHFNDNQILDTIFCYVQSREGFDPINPEDVGVPIFSSFDVTEQNCENLGVEYLVPSSSKSWIKVLNPASDVHYEFQDDCLAMVTLMRSTERA